MKKLSHWIMSATVLGLFALGCEEPAEVPTTGQSEISSPSALSKNNVIQHASLGGADICEALGMPTGCDANFSLVANEKANSGVSGQWQDTFAGGGEGIHVAVDCMNIVGGNFAIIGGVVTHGTAGGVDVSGRRAVTAVVDNGTSANDPADQLSFSFFEPFATQFLGTNDCNALTPANFQGPGFLFNLAHGQVKVR